MKTLVLLLACLAFAVAQDTKGEKGQKGELGLQGVAGPPGIAGTCGSCTDGGVREHFIMYANI